MKMEQSNWDDKFQKIWSLFNQGGEHRKMAYSLLDGLVEVVVASGQTHQLDTIFEGISIQRDGLSLPDVIRKELNEIQVSRWNKGPLRTGIDNCGLMGIYDLYFRVFPEKIQELPEFLCLEACDQVPSFCGPHSPVRALGILPPFKSLKGLQKYSNIERVHLYGTVPTFATFKGLRDFTRSAGMSMSAQQMLEAAQLCCRTPHIQHVFTFNHQITVQSISQLESTNLQAKNPSLEKLKYASKVRKRFKDTLMETVTTVIDGQRQFVIDSAGLTSGDLGEHPSLAVSTNFLTDVPKFLQYTTPHSLLKQLRQDPDGSLYQTVFVLNDKVHDTIGERIEAIEVLNDFEAVNTLLSQGTFPNCTQLVFNSSIESWRYHGKITVELSKSFLQRWPALEVLKHSFMGWSDKVQCTIADDFWSVSHPLRMVWNQTRNGSTGIGFRNEEGTFAERILAWQENISLVQKHQEHISPIEHLRLHRGDSIGALLPYIPNIKTLETFPSTLILNDVDGHVRSFDTVDWSIDIDTVHMYRPTVMRRIATVKDAKRMLMRKELLHREVLNAKIPVAVGFHEDLDNSDPKVVDALLSDWSNNKDTIKVGRYLYVQQGSGWNKTAHQTLDAEYTNQPRFVGEQSHAQLNLKLAFFQRPFQIEYMPKTSKVWLNTDKVTVMDLKNCDWIRSLRIDRMLSDAEWNSLKHLQNLKILYVHDICGDTMESIHPEVFTLKNLRELYLPNKDISSISDDLKNLVHLEKLSLRGNPIGCEEQAVLFTYLETLPHFTTLYFDVDVEPAVGFTIA
jgi:hypothetical protein